jgi:hypothetical protein
MTIHWSCVLGSFIAGFLTTLLALYIGFRRGYRAGRADEFAARLADRLSPSLMRLAASGLSAHTVADRLWTFMRRP